MRFQLSATVSTDNPVTIRPILRRLMAGSGSVREVDRGVFSVSGNLEGTSAKELNRWLLSELRRAEKRTRLRAEWTSHGSTERYFDYVLKKKT